MLLRREGQPQRAIFLPPRSLLVLEGGCPPSLPELPACPPARLPACLPDPALPGAMCLCPAMHTTVGSPSRYSMAQLSLVPFACVCDCCRRGALLLAALHPPPQVRPGGTRQQQQQWGGRGGAPGGAPRVPHLQAGKWLWSSGVGGIRVGLG